MNAPVDVKAMHTYIGQLTLDNDFSRKHDHQGGVAERKAITNHIRALLIKRKAELTGISHSSVLFPTQPVGATDVALMRLIDELYLEHPPCMGGSRMLRDQLNRASIEVGWKHVGTLMNCMGLRIYIETR